MVMMYGISDSIKKALATQIRQEKVTTVSNFSVIDYEISDSESFAVGSQQRMNLKIDKNEGGLRRLESSNMSETFQDDENLIDK